MARQSDLSLDDRVRDTPRTSTSFVLPAAVNERLDWIVDAAIEAGEDRRLSRTDILCALIVAAPSEGADLRLSLERYRQALVRDLLTREGQAANVVSLRDRRPGPRRRA